MLKPQSMPPWPVPVEIMQHREERRLRGPRRVLPGRRSRVGRPAPPVFSTTLTECVSDRSTSSKLSVPVGTGLVVSGDCDPVTPACSTARPTPVRWSSSTASLAPVMTTETVCVELVEPSADLDIVVHRQRSHWPQDNRGRWSAMAKFQSMLPATGARGNRAASSSARPARSACVAAGGRRPGGGTERDRRPYACRRCPWSVNASVPAGTVGVVSGTDEPVVACLLGHRWTIPHRW